MDETFIWMCKEATEIQDIWKPKIGDLYLMFEPDTLEPLKECINFDILFVYQMMHESKVWWLPRQEDLQNIIKRFQNIDTELDLLKGICKWSKSPMEWINFLDFDLNQLWLVFVMETCYNKQWNGESWENIQ